MLRRSVVFTLGAQSDVMTWAIAIVLRPFAALVLFGLICLPARLWVQRRMKDGAFKRLLLLRIGNGWGGQRDS